MRKILKFEEIKENQHVEYSEGYVIEFWIYNDGDWERKTELYFGKTKGEHESVIKRWRSDYRNKLVEYISVT